MESVVEYQKFITDTRLTDTSGLPHVVFATLGMIEEVGEFAGKLKRIFRDHGGTMSEEMRRDLIKELGDSQWYHADAADALRSSLREVLEVNVRKIADRKNRGVVGGSGDNR